MVKDFIQKKRKVLAGLTNFLSIANEVLQRKLCCRTSGLQRERIADSKVNFTLLCLRPSECYFASVRVWRRQPPAPEPEAW